MNKYNLLYTSGVAQRISTLATLFLNTRILLVDSNENIRPEYRRFFDVIATSNAFCLENGTADIYIDLRETPYTDGILDLSIFKFDKVIFVLRPSFIDVLKKINIKLRNYVVVSNATDPSQEFALTCFNATLVYKTSCDMKQITDFISAKNKYGIDINIKHKNRNSFIDI